MYYWSSLTAADIPNTLNDICNSENNNSKIIAIQTGAWDLTYYPLRRSLHDPNGLSKLINYFRDVMSGNSTCHGLQHMVLVTTPPHPHCHNIAYTTGSDDINVNKCEYDRYFRTNAAIAAFTTKLLDGVLRNSSRMTSNIRISIIDFFGIVRPRLMLYEDNEVICQNHFVCSIMWNAASSIVYTPGGKAVTDALIHAIFSVNHRLEK
jgi:hypothetical protein